MKIKFQNLGSIKKAELDLRPLTVIIGPNNSNKTYIAYSIYGLWKQINTNDAFFLYKRLFERFSEKLTNEQQDIISLDINKYFLVFLSEYIEDFVKSFKGNVLESFFQDSSHKIFKETSFQIEIPENTIREAINKVLNQSFSISLKELGISKVEYNNEKLLLFLDNPSENAVSRVTRIILLVINEIFSDSLPFPAERNAFINTYKLLANRRYKFLKESQRGLFINKNIADNKRLELLREQGDTHYPQPVEDFLDFLSDIELENSPDPDPKNKNEFQQLADQIEEYIQNKNKTKFKNTKFGGKEIKVSVKRGLEIDLYNASSSIKQLAPLLLYLHYRAKVGDFLVIDEPEMNLHPESQVKLLEAFSILVNLGVRVLLTTHSPYIMAHLNNIVNGNHEDQDILENQAQSLYLQDFQAFLKMDQVSAYEIKENKLLSLHDPDYGIRWDTLSDVSVDVQQKFFAIYEAGQKNNETNETEEE
jgi:predicted ATPase